MKKSKKLKKEDVVEVSKVAFRNNRQSGKSFTRAEVIKKVVGDDDVVKVSYDSDEKSVSDNTEDRNPDMESDGEKMESLDAITETNTTSEEDAIQIFRDVMSMSDEDRNSESDGKLAPLRLTPPPPPSWTDNPKNIKFNAGEFVRYKGCPGGSVYKVCGQDRKENTYSIKGSGSRDPYTEDGEKLVKVNDKNVNWVDYWKLHPVIPAPKPWLKKKEEPKRKK
jgi:hypothetical protein